MKDMVSKSHAKRRQDIKTKLMAAVAMLLVSSIMMVSTTYAWFTLSTAPEVTGITTAVGANGNLEMALLPASGLTTDIGSSVGDSSKPIVERNVTWGNLVELGDNTTYGLDKITLYPSALNVDASGKIVVSGFLKTPTYGPDGRISGELIANTTTSVYNGEEFPENASGSYGVRAIGTASGMTDRQLAYRNAVAAGNSAKSMAANIASQSLTQYGGDLADIAIKKGTNESDEAKIYTEVHLASMQNIINGLVGTITFVTDGEGNPTTEVKSISSNSALGYIEEAYKQYILAYAASSLVAEQKTGDVVNEIQPWNTIAGMMATNTLNEIVAAINTANLQMPTGFSTAIENLNNTIAAVANAQTKLNGLYDNNDETETLYSWTEISPVLTALANPNNMKVNNFDISTIMSNKDAFVTSVMGKGIQVAMTSGAGVYADIADHCGDYKATVVIPQVEYGGLSLTDVSAQMTTESSLSATSTNYLVVASAAVSGKTPENGSAEIKPITDFYGYIIDLAFRTNAAESNLNLQIDAVDRIYSDNSNEETMGHGSSMTFSTADANFSEAQMKSLVEAIKIVFFDPETGTIYCYAGLDAQSATTGANGFTAKMYIKSGANETNYRKAVSGEVATHVKVETYVADDNGTYVADAGAEGGYRLKTDSDTDVDLFRKEESYRLPNEGETAEYVVDDSSAKIMALTQNTAHRLSVLVYLDGELVGNDDVAATASPSLTGSLNLQFASSAILVPMDYAALHQAATPANP